MNDYDLIGIQSLPRTNEGKLDERKIYNLIGKAGLPFDSLDCYPYEIIFYLEGRLDMEREFHELNGYNLFSSIRQALSKQKEFKNAFEKKEEKQVASKESEKHTIKSLEDIFGL